MVYVEVPCVRGLTLAEFGDERMQFHSYFVRRFHAEIQVKSVGTRIFRFRTDRDIYVVYAHMFCLYPPF